MKLLQRTALFLPLALAVVLPAAGSAARAQDGPSEATLQRANKLVSAGFQALGNGKTKRAKKSFEDAEAMLGGPYPPAALGLASAANRDGDHAEAATRARQVLQAAPRSKLAMRAASELARAVASNEAVGSREELYAAVQIVRAQLEAAPADGFSDSLRIDLCMTRRSLPNTHPLGPHGALGDAEPLDLGPFETPSTDREAEEKSATERSEPPRLVLGGVGERRVVGSSRDSYSYMAPPTQGFVARSGFASVLVDTDGCVIEAVPPAEDHPARGDRVPEAAEDRMLSETAVAWVFEPWRVSGQPVAFRWVVSHGSFSVTVSAGRGRP